jgi:hypothetical protein
VRDFWEENEIQHLDWPTCSPDMNPIKNLWAEVTRYLNNLQHSPTNVNQLRVALNDAWAAIPNETLASLVSSMPRRIQALLDARGGYTRFLSVNKLKKKNLFQVPGKKILLFFYAFQKYQSLYY